MHVASRKTADDDVRERLLRTVEKLGNEVGEHGLTDAQIAACAGVGTGVLQRHFAGRDALVREVRARFEAEIGDAMARAREGAWDSHAQLHRMCIAYVEVARRDRWRYPLATREYDAGAHALTIPLARTFVAETTACLVDDADPSALALRIWQAIHALVNALRQHDSRPPGMEERRYVDRWVRMTLSSSGAETLDRL